MRLYLIALLKMIEKLIPPPMGSHHTIQYAESGDLAIHLSRIEGVTCFFFCDQDFDKSPEILAEELFKLYTQKIQWN